VDIEFTGKIFHWQGPAPYYFVAVPAQPRRDLKAISELVTYGWGVIPVQARIGDTTWKTSLIPKDGRYLVPLRVSVQKAERLREGARVTVRLAVTVR
jgi:hypothetical protein